MCQNSETIEQAIQQNWQSPGREWHPSDCVQEQAVANNWLLVKVRRTLKRMTKAEGKKN